MFMPRPPIATLPSHDPLFLLRRADLPLRHFKPNVAGGQPLLRDVDFTAELDPEAAFTAKWHSPRGRILELDFQPKSSVRWFGLHIPIDPDMRSYRWYGFALRHAASRPVGFRAALRADGQDEADIFFPRHLMVGPQQGDHIDFIDPSFLPDFPLQVRFRELILFLPVSFAYQYVLHDLRLVRL